jgi:hypothetical protein
VEQPVLPVLNTASPALHSAHAAAPVAAAKEPAAQLVQLAPPVAALNVPAAQLAQLEAAAAEYLPSPQGEQAAEPELPLYWPAVQLAHAVAAAAEYAPMPHVTHEDAPLIACGEGGIISEWTTKISFSASNGPEEENPFNGQQTQYPEKKKKRNLSTP